MLEYFYKERRTLVDFRRGPLGPHFDGFAGQLKQQGYGPHHAKHVLGLCCQFNAFLIEKGVARAALIRPALAEAFGNVYLAGFRTIHPYSAKRPLQMAFRHLFDYLIEADVIERFGRPPRTVPS